jgi:TorA maturation chaperone TorD
VATQRAFFEDHIEPWVFACCDAILQSSVANYYRWVAELTSSFLAVERDSLAID